MPALRPREWRRAAVHITAAVVGAVGVAACGGGADRSARVEQNLRRVLTAPGPDQIMPDGRRPRRIACQASNGQTWTCRVSYPAGLELQCVVNNVRARGPVCADAAS